MSAPCTQPEPLDRSNLLCETVEGVDYAIPCITPTLGDNKDDYRPTSTIVVPRYLTGHDTKADVLVCVL